MLHEFLSANRESVIERCRLKVAARPGTEAGASEPQHGIPLFVDQLIKTLQIEQTPDRGLSTAVSGPAGGNDSGASEVGSMATRHGRELRQRGFTIDQVVHDYGDLCQAVTDLAFELDAPITVDEFRTLNRCLDNAIADAVTEFSYQHDVVVAEKLTGAFNERLGFLAHDLRNQLHTATLALSAVKAGDVGMRGATGSLLTNSLTKLGALIDRSLVDVRMSAGLPGSPQRIFLAEFIAEVQGAALLDASAHQCFLRVAAVDPELAVDADRDVLFSAVGNLLQNAFKFTGPQTEVSLKTYAAFDRVRIDINDKCGGLPRGDTEKIFEPFIQAGTDRSGLGLGLAMSRRGIEAIGGTLTASDRPGAGCTFTIDLPRCAVPKGTTG